MGACYCRHLHCCRCRDLRYPGSTIAIGLYLPIYLTVPIMIGGLIRLFIEKRRFADEVSRETVRNNGILFSSGMIAGEGLVGILLAVLAVFGVSDRINLELMGFHLGNGAAVCSSLPCFSV